MNTPLWRQAGKWLRRRLGPWLGVHDQYAPRPLNIERCNHPALPAKPPVISIVTPSYQQGRFLERTLLSVLDQAYPRLELIVQDGGSRDETRDLLERYGPRLHHVESAPDRGQAHAINLGFRHASGEVLAYLNSDDLLLPGSLATVADFFARHDDVDVIYGHRVVINAAGEEVGRWVMPRHDPAALEWNDYIPQETLFWRRRIWKRIGGQLNEELQSALDWDLLLRFRRAGARFVRLPHFLGAFRIHPEQKSDAWLLRVGIPEQRRLREEYHGRQVSCAELWRRVLPYLGKSIAYQWLYRMKLLRY